MMNSKALPPLGPGVGSLVAGLAWAEMDGARSKRVAELESALFAEQDRLCLAQAAQSASRDLANAMVAELRAEASGSNEARMLSKPENGELRRAYVVVQTDAELRRRSHGRLHGRPDEVAAARAIVAKGLNTGQGSYPALKHRPRK